MHVMEVGELCFAWLQARAVATDLLATLHRLRRDKTGVRLMAVSTGIDPRDRLVYYEEHVQAIPRA